MKIVKKIYNKVIKKISNNPKKALSAVCNILNSSNKEINSYDFILEQIKLFGLSNLPWDCWGKYLKWRNSTEFGLMQYPSEFAEFSLFISKYKISNAIEIGVFQGASSYFLAAILQRVNPNIEYNMVDICDNIICYDKFSKLLNIKKHIPSTSKEFYGKEFDFVFIDADHSYDGVLEDFNNVGIYCKKIVSFHDIYAHEYNHLNGCTVRMWNEFKNRNDFDKYEFTKYNKKWMWIGVGIRKY